MLSISYIAVPVFMDTTTESAHLFYQWVRLYNYGHMTLPALSVLTFALYMYTCHRKREANKPWRIFALAGLATVSMIPFTWIFMVPTNNELFRLREVSKIASTMSISDAKKLVSHWSWLHSTRSCLPLAGAIIGTIGALL